MPTTLRSTAVRNQNENDTTEMLGAVDLTVVIVVSGGGGIIVQRALKGDRLLSPTSSQIVTIPRHPLIKARPYIGPGTTTQYSTY